MITWPVFIKKTISRRAQTPIALLGPLCNTWPGEQEGPHAGMDGLPEEVPQVCRHPSEGSLGESSAPSLGDACKCSVPDAELGPGLLSPGVISQFGELITVCAGLGNSGLEGTRG